MRVLDSAELPDLTPQGKVEERRKLEADMAEWLSKGNQITKITDFDWQDMPPNVRAGRRIGGAKASAMAKADAESRRNRVNWIWDNETQNVQEIAEKMGLSVSTICAFLRDSGRREHGAPRKEYQAERVRRAPYHK